MGSKVITFSLPQAMLRKIDEIASIDYQTRSSFIRWAIVKYIEKIEEEELEKRKQFGMHSDRQLVNIYDFEEEYEETISDQKS